MDDKTYDDAGGLTWVTNLPLPTLRKQLCLALELLEMLEEIPQNKALIDDWRRRIVKGAQNA